MAGRVLSEDLHCNRLSEQSSGWASRFWPQNGAHCLFSGLQFWPGFSISQARQIVRFGSHNRRAKTRPCRCPPLDCAAPSGPIDAPVVDIVGQTMSSSLSPPLEDLFWALRVSRCSPSGRFGCNFHKIHTYATCFVGGRKWPFARFEVTAWNLQKTCVKFAQNQCALYMGASWSATAKCKSAAALPIENNATSFDCCSAYQTSQTAEMPNGGENPSRDDNWQCARNVTLTGLKLSREQALFV